LRTKIGLINLMEVLKTYTKVADFNNANKAMLEPYQAKAKELQEKVEELNKLKEDKGLSEERRTQIEKKLRTAQRQWEDLQVEAKQVFAKKDEEQMLVVYKEVMAEAERYAKAHGLELVMHYNDLPPDSADYFSPGNVRRKLQVGATIPMYIAPGLDITKEIVAILNARVGKEKEKDKQGQEKDEP
jgi:Skp family chaperone for outer membrane proteins